MYGCTSSGHLEHYASLRGSLTASLIDELKNLRVNIMKLPESRTPSLAEIIPTVIPVQKMTPVS